VASVGALISREAFRRWGGRGCRPRAVAPYEIDLYAGHPVFVVKGKVDQDAEYE